MMDYIKVSKAISYFCSEIESHGCEFFVSNQVAELEECINGTDKVLTTFIRRTLNTVFPDDFFFIVCRGKENGSPVGLCAGRRERVQGWSLAHYWSEYIPRTVTTASGTPARLLSVTAAADFRPNDAVYLCEMWVNPAWRRHGIGTLMGNLAQLYALAQFNPEIVYGFISHQDVLERGLGVNYGWTELHPDALRWQEAPLEIPEKVFYVANRRSALLDLCERAAVLAQRSHTLSRASAALREGELAR